MQQKKILIVSLFLFVISACGGGGSSSETPQQNSIIPAPSPTPPPSSVTSNLVAQAKGTINGEMSYKGINREFILYVLLVMTALQNNHWSLIFMAMGAMPMNK